MRKAEPLTPEQLTDLVNYILGLPIRSIITQKILTDRIPLVVVRTWALKYDRLHVERWCESVLITYRMMPRPDWWRGVYSVPRQLYVWGAR